MVRINKRPVEFRTPQVTKDEEKAYIEIRGKKLGPWMAKSIAESERKTSEERKAEKLEMLEARDRLINQYKEARIPVPITLKNVGNEGLMRLIDSVHGPFGSDLFHIADEFDGAVIRAVVSYYEKDFYRKTA